MALPIVAVEQVVEVHANEVADGVETPRFESCERLVPSDVRLIEGPTIGFHMLLFSEWRSAAPAPPLPVSLLPLKIDHRASLDFALMHAGENAVDVFKACGCDGRLDLALAREVQGLL